MKRKNILSLVLLLMFQISLAFAQQPPNQNFENHESDSQNGVGKRPVSWFAANVKRTVVGVTAKAELVSEASDGRTGKCVYLHNEKVEAASIGAVAPAWISLGKPWNYLSGIDQGTASAGTDGGMVFKYRPDSLSVWIKRDYSAKTEDANIVVYLWKGTSEGKSYRNQDGGCSSTGTHYDEESDIRRNYDANACGTSKYATQIGEGSWRSTAKYSKWTQIKVPITYLNNEKPEKMNIILSASNYPNFRQSTGVNEGAKLWCDDISFIYSSIADDMLLNNRPMSGFESGKYEYTFALGANAESVPDIRPKRSGRELASSEYTVDKGAIGEFTTVTITAEDGSSTTTYKIKFIAEMSKNPRPNNILINGQEIDNFNGFLYNYNIEMPFGTTDVPTVDVQIAEDGQTYSVSLPSSLPGSATVNVVAPDTDYSQSYTINFTVGTLKDNTLSGIFFGNGSDRELIPNFNPSVNNYVIELPVGTATAPVVSYDTNYPDDHIIVVDDKGLAGLTISVTPKGTSLTRVYRITYRITESTNSYLNDIKVGGQTIEGFSPSTFVYSYNLPLGTSNLPEITWEKGDKNQTVELTSGGLDGETRITVTSQSGSISTYKITFSLSKSSISTLKNILIDGVQIDNFSAEKTDYVVSLPIGTTQMPTITWEKGDAYQTVKSSISNLAGTSRLTVTAQNGDVTAYTIKFSVAQASNTTLQDILLDGVSLENFDANTLVYDIQLERGAQEIPEITYVASDATQTIRIVKGGINATTRITVKAQSGASAVYELNFSVIRSSVATLNDIKVDGVSLADFAADTHDYSYTLPSGTIDLPAIEVVKGDDFQSIVVSHEGVNGVSRITVNAEDGTQAIYTIAFSVEKSASALLKMIYVDGVALRNFDPETMAYTVTLPLGATACPDITVEKDGVQTITTTKPALDGVAKIEVKPEVGSKNIYTINFQFLSSEDTQLADITVGGFSIEGFDPEKYDYVYTLEEGETRIPTVGYTRNDKKQQVYVANGALGAVTTITVRAESGAVAKYNVLFKKWASKEVHLNAIYVDGVLIDGFDKDVYNYQYVLPVESIEAPSVSFDKAYSNQEVSYILPKLDGEAIFTVLSEDKSDTTVYTITFLRTMKSVKYLAEILVDGNNVLTDETEDIISLDIAAHHTPVLSFVPNDLSQNIFVADGGATGAQILVVAADNSEHTYYIEYNILPSDDCALNDVQILGKSGFSSLAGFSSEALSYAVTLDKGTEVVPNIHVVPAEENAKVTITYGGVNEKTIIDVLAEDGVTTKRYEINFSVQKSSVSALAGISLDGVALADFAADKFDYDYALPYGEQSLPVVTWDLAFDADGKYESGQKISLLEEDDRITLKVVSEDETSTSLYKINIEKTHSSKSNELVMITLGSDMLPGFTPSKTDYQVVLPYGTTTMPELGYTKNYDEQSVSVKVASVLDDAATITVQSNIEGVDDIVYNIEFSVERNHPLAITSLKIDGVAAANFDPMKTSYVIPVTAKPTIEYTLGDAADATVLVNNHKLYKFEVYSPSTTDVMVYEFYFYYKNDVIPNGDFSDWSAKTKYNNKTKPTGWMVPADCDDTYSVTDRYTTGNEVVKSSDDAMLRTWSQRYSIHGSLPGMMSLTGMSIKFAGSGDTESSVTGGISFRNTPDVLTVDYKPVSKTSAVNNMRVVYRLSENGSVFKEKTFADATFNNTWKKMRLELNTGLQYPTKMNIILNSAHTESSKNEQIDQTGSSNFFSPETKKESEVHFDNVQFEYNKNLSTIYVGTQEIKILDQSITSYTVDIPSETVVIPAIKTVGQVADQDHTVLLSAEVAGVTVATIKVKAENGDEKTYTVNIRRSESNNTNLKSIKVDGAQIDGFASDVLEYTIPLANGTTTMPDVSIEGNLRQVINTTYANNVLTIDVQAENRMTKQYKVTFVEQKDAVTALQNLQLEGLAFAYDASTMHYDVNISKDDALPKIVFERMSAGQRVNVTTANDTATIAVLAQDETTKAEYKIAFLRPIEPTSSLLASLTYDGMAIDAFSSNSFNYELQDPAAQAAWNFVTASSRDKVVQTITKDNVSFAVEGDLVNTYNVAMNYAKSANTDLANMKFNDENYDGFSPALRDYVIEYTMSDEVHLIASVDDVASISIVRSAKESMSEMSARAVSSPLSDYVYKFATQAQDGSVDTVSVAFDYIKNGEVKLSDLQFDGARLVENTSVYSSSAAFDADIMNYDIILKSETPKVAEPNMPIISAAASAVGQTVKIENNGVNATSYVTVTAENGAERIYNLNVETEKANNATLKDIIVDMKPLNAFDANTYEYEIAISNNTLPLISYVGADEFQAITMQQNETSTSIRVISEDKADTSFYVIKYAIQHSNVATLNNIIVNGEQLSNFASDVFDYTLELPLGSNILTDINVEAGDNAQDITISNVASDNFNAHVTITVVAEDGVTTNVYNVNISLLKSTNNLLEMIYLDGKEIVADKVFSADENTYVVTLPVGTTQLPLVTWKAADVYQTIYKTDVAADNITITVDPQTENMTNVYSITFVTLESENAQLNSIEIDGEAISIEATGFVANREFRSDIYEYIITLPVGSTVVPNVSWQQGDQWQTVTIENAESVNDTAFINVVADNDAFTATYKVIFKRALSTNLLLNMISIDNVPLDSFAPNNLYYTLKLPYAVTELPAVTWEVSDEYQTVTKHVDEHKNTVKLTVEAEDKASSMTYVIVFEIAKSNVTALDAILVDGELINGFDASIYEYKVVLPYGTQRIPSVHVRKGEQKQIVSITPAETFSDTTSVIVFAEDDETQAEYRIYYEITPSDNAYLDMISIDGVDLTTQSPTFSADKDFSASEFAYNVVLPYGTTKMPAIHCSGQVADYDTIEVTNEGINGVTLIKVVSQDGFMINEYRISFSVAKSDNAMLSDILLDDKSIAKFNPAVFEYTISYPVGTKVEELPTTDNFSFVKADELQNVTVTNADATTIQFTVTAENGKTVNVYVVMFDILLSDNALLDNIFIDGIGVSNFANTQFEYSYLLLPGAIVPELTVEKGEEVQEVLIVPAPVGEPSYIYVTAENGEESTYIINFKYTNENPGIEASYKDVAWQPIGGGQYKASSLRENVKVRIVSLGGGMLREVDVAVIDPNENITQQHESGTILQFDASTQMYIYVFVSNGKVISSGKFIVSY